MRPASPVTMLMGCYGIGVTRIVAAAIEQNHDERGIIWPDPIAPFHVVLVPLNLQKSARVRAAADALYEQLCAAGIEVLYDDRDARPGVKFADAELLGIPHRIVVGERGLEAGTLEYRASPRAATARNSARDERAGVHPCAPAALGVLSSRHSRSRRCALTAAAHVRRRSLRLRDAAQQDPELRRRGQQAIGQAQCFADSTTRRCGTR